MCMWITNCTRIHSTTSLSEGISIWMVVTEALLFIVCLMISLLFMSDAAPMTPKKPMQRSLLWLRGILVLIPIVCRSSSWWMVRHTKDLHPIRLCSTDILLMERRSWFIIDGDQHLVSLLSSFKFLCNWLFGSNINIHLYKKVAWLKKFPLHPSLLVGCRSIFGFVHSDPFQNSIIFLFAVLIIVLLLTTWLNQIVKPGVLPPLAWP